MQMSQKQYIARFSDFILVENGMVKLHDSVLALEDFLLMQNKVQVE